MDASSPGLARHPVSNKTRSTRPTCRGGSDSGSHDLLWELDREGIRLVKPTS